MPIEILLLIVLVALIVKLFMPPRKCGCERELKEIEERLNFQGRAIREILHLLRHPHSKQTGFEITQLGGVMPITGIVVGSQGVFQETVLPAGATIPAGTTPVWTTSDATNTTLSPSPDGTQVMVTVASTAPAGGSFSLTVANQDGTFPTSVTVPFLPGTVVTPQTGFQIDQLS